jgi:hypothetical protein
LRNITGNLAQLMVNNICAIHLDMWFILSSRGPFQGDSKQNQCFCLIKMAPDFNYDAANPQRRRRPTSSKKYNRLLEIKDDILLKLLAAFVTFLTLLIVTNASALSIALALLCVHHCLDAVLRRRRSKKTAAAMNVDVTEYGDYIRHMNGLMWRLLWLLLFIISLEVLLADGVDRRLIVLTGVILVLGRLMANLRSVVALLRSVNGLLHPKWLKARWNS